MSARRAWATVAALFAVAVFAWGLAFYSLGFYLRELHRLHGWSLASLSWVTLLFYAVATLCTFGVAEVLAARGPKVVFGAGGLLLGAGVAAVGQVRAPWQLVVAYLVLAAGWSSLNLYPISAIVLAWFPERNGPPLALALTGASAGGVVMIPLLTSLTEARGLGGALLVVGGVAAAVVAVLAITVIALPPAQPEPPGGTNGAHGAHDAHGANGAGGPAVTGAAAWGLARTRRFWVLLGALAAAFAVQVGLLVHQLSLLAEHLDDGAASKVVGMTTAAALGGRLVFMALSTRWPIARLGAAYLAGQVIGLVLIGSASSPAALAAGCALFGWGVGVLITIPPLLVRAAFADTAFTAAFPVFNIGLQLAIAAGAPLTAALHDGLGGYGAGVRVLAALDAMAVVLLLLATRSPSPGPAPTPTDDAIAIPRGLPGGCAARPVPGTGH